MSSQRSAIRALAKERNKKRSSEDGSSKHKHKKHKSDNDSLALRDEDIPEKRTALPPPPAHPIITGTLFRQVIEVGSKIEPDVPFVPSWSVLTKDSALGDHNVCKEMVLKGVLPKDCASLNACPNSTIATCTYDMICTLSCYASEAAKRLEMTTSLYDEEKDKSKRLEALAQKRGSDLEKISRALSEANSENASLKAKLVKAQEEFEAAKKKYVEEGVDLFLEGFDACKKAVTGLAPDFPVGQLEVPDEEEGGTSGQQPPTDDDQL